MNYSKCHSHVADALLGQTVISDSRLSITVFWPIRKVGLTYYVWSNIKEIVETRYG